MDEHVGKKAILLRGFASGLVGEIQKTKNGYMHVTKSGLKTRVRNQEDIKIL